MNKVCLDYQGLLDLKVIVELGVMMDHQAHLANVDHKEIVVPLDQLAQKVEVELMAVEAPLDPME